MKPIKRTDAEWMMVWDDENDKRKRLVTQIFDNGSCAAVEDNYAQEYLDGKAAHLLIWAHHEPIPKKKTRPRTPEERVLFCCQNPTTAIRYNHRTAWMAGTGEWIPGPEAQWCTTDGDKFGEPQDFVIEVEE